MADGFDEIYVATRRQLRGVAESLIAGPQYRSSGTIRLAVRPDGFAAVALPVAVHGTELVLPNDAVHLAGPLRSVAEVAGIDAGPPEGADEIVDPLPPDVELTLDTEAAEWMYRSQYAGGHALKHVLPECHPAPWPEHFDVAAASEDEVNMRLGRRRPPPDAVRLRRPVAGARRTVLERAVRGAVPADPADDVDELANAWSPSSSAAAPTRQESVVTEFDLDFNPEYR